MCTYILKHVNMPQFALEFRVAAVLEAVQTFIFELGHVCSMFSNTCNSAVVLTDSPRSV